MREEEELQEAIRRSLADQESSGEMQVDLNGGVGWSLQVVLFQ